MNIVFKIKIQKVRFCFFEEVSSFAGSLGWGGPGRSQELWPSPAPVPGGVWAASAAGNTRGKPITLTFFWICSRARARLSSCDVRGFGTFHAVMQAELSQRLRGRMEWRRAQQLIGESVLCFGFWDSIRDATNHSDLLIIFLSDWWQNLLKTSVKPLMCTYFLCLMANLPIC